MKTDREVQKRLLEIIEKSGLSKRKFALSIGTSASTISEIFRGRIKSLSGTTLKILELKYGVNPVWLETGIGDPYRRHITITNKNEVYLVGLTRQLSPENKEFLENIIEDFAGKNSMHRNIIREILSAEKIDV